MFLHRSNYSERLVDELAEIVRTPQRDPFAPELIAVQSKGMERWLALELSARLSVWANAELPFPRHMLLRVFDAVLGEEAAACAPFDEASLAFAVAAELHARAGEPVFAPVARYLQADPDGSARLQLAGRIARAFDDYSVYRPELLRAWAQGADDGGWEAELWRALLRAHGRGHQAARAERCIAALRARETGGAERGNGAAGNGLGARRGLPERLCVFGVSTLPPLYLDVLSALSEHVQTHLFLLSPSRHYFADLRRPRADAGTTTTTSTQGHPLLASLGRVGRELQDLLEERTRYVETERDLYVSPGDDCLLHTLQSDVLELRARGADGAAEMKAIAPDDESLSIAVCHGPMRELEVLHDQLLSLLADERLQPHQIVVMAPDIETYAPLIEAVFGTHSGRPQIPFSVADRRTRTTHAVIDALFSLVETLRGRLHAGAVLDLLGVDYIRARFSVSNEELGRLREWVEQSGIRWGADADHRAEVGQPAFSENTWRFGLDRLLLGLALGGDDDALYAGALPLDEVEGSEAALLGKLSALCERLFDHRRTLCSSRTLPEWQRAIAALLDDFVASGPETSHERGLIQSTLARIAEDAACVRFDQALDLRSLLSLLESRLDERLPARGLLARGVTFCQLVPMRSIPFEVVCLLGMNDDAFPKPNAPLSFDRLADHAARKPGDRSPRDDDRYMFLEALLCARRRLLISYVGRSVRDNRERPPSVVVGELLDAITQGFVPSGTAADASAGVRRAAVERRLCVQHRLQAFSPRYFEREDPQLFSYSRVACEAARALRAPRVKAHARGPSLLPEAPRSELGVDELVRAIAAPVRTFAQQRLGLMLGDELAPLAEREPVELDPLSRWKLRDQLLRARLRGVEASALLPLLRAAGTLPLGGVGTVAYDQLHAEIEPLVEAALALRRGAELEPLPIELTVRGVRVHGAISGLWPAGQLEVSVSKAGRRFELEHFVRHVLLGAQLAHEARRGYGNRGVVLARGDGGDVQRAVFGPLDEPQLLLETLVDLAQLCRRAALPFEYFAGRKYQEERNLGKSAAEALLVAEADYENERGANDAYARYFYPRFADLLDATGVPGFEQICARVLAPLFACRESEAG